MNFSLWGFRVLYLFLQSLNAHFLMCMYIPGRATETEKWSKMTRKNLKPAVNKQKQKTHFYNICVVSEKLFSRG